MGEMVKIIKMQNGNENGIEHRGNENATEGATIQDVPPPPPPPPQYPNGKSPNK